MKKFVCLAALVFALALLASPALAGTTTCDQTFEVVPGQVVTLTAKPDTPAQSDWMYLWTGQDGGSTTEHNHEVLYTAPAYDSASGATNTYDVTLTTSNTYTTESCSDLCTIHFHCNPPACPLDGADVCATLETDGSHSYPTESMDYTGLTHDYYTYHWIAHNSGGNVALKEATDDPHYTLDWTQLDQPSATDVEVCTDVYFYITTPGSTVHLQECHATYCISYDPTADITVDTGTP